MAIWALYSAVTKQGKFLLLANRMKDQWLFFSNHQSIVKIKKETISLMATPVSVFLKCTDGHR